MLCIVAAVTLASGTVTQKVVLRRLSGLQTITACCVIGVVLLLPFTGVLVGFLTWAFALVRSPAGSLGATTFLVPAVSVILGWVLLGEAPVAWAYARGRAVPSWRCPRARPAAALATPSGRR